jgi:hypothetical protein
VLHELGHWSAAVWLGFPDPVLHYSSISHGDIASWPSWAHGVVGLAGPTVTVIITLLACSWTVLRRDARWAFALSVSAASRFAVGVPYTAVNAVVLLTGGRLHPPAFDEYKAATALGWSGDAVLAFTSVFLIATLTWVAMRLPHGERAAAWAGLLGGTALGWVLWMSVLGPVLLA